jgi:hypothetical protein
MWNVTWRNNAVTEQRVADAIGILVDKHPLPSF